ncbi:diacylglycerol kinase family protein [Nocardioides sp.]|uniref:diacylglycerol/lipid kinase family protein n=1 Tax=Nocardioides sp. TaxID=35761 RepID=UPI00356287C8
MDPLLVITNSDAGPDEDESLAAALEVLHAHCSVEVASTGKPGELDGVLHRAGSRRLIVAGGDGSMHAVISALYRRLELKGSVIGLLPLGTGNDFARANGIPLDPAEAAQVICEGATRDRDILIDEVGAVVVNNVHAGAGAVASRRAAGWKERLGAVGVAGLNLGRLGYPIGAALTALKPPSVRLRVEVDGEPVVDVDEPILMVAVGNAAQVGGGTELIPEADPGDAMVDVMVSRSVSPIARLGYGTALLRGKHHDRDDVTYLRGHTVSVSGEEFWCSADGEIYGPERTRTWRVEPAAYSLVVPA